MNKEQDYTIYAAATAAVTPLAWTLAGTYARACNGESAARLYTAHWDNEAPFFASLFDREALEEVFRTQNPVAQQKYTAVEKISILALQQAFQQTDFNPAADDVLFLFSTTKGNIELLEKNDGFEPERIYLWRTAQLIAEHFGNHNTPVIVSNACISGVAAQIEAAHYLQYGHYQHVVVIGCETLSKFIVSGFQSFKALSAERCRPFDPERTGLNLGEAAAVIVYSKTQDATVLPAGTLLLRRGSINNDANHISGPSRTGEGLLRAITNTLADGDVNSLAFLNAHGTATLYNDDMESIAIQRAGLQHIPVNSLKGYFGHTLGAAGVLEVIIAAMTLRDGVMLPSLGTGTARPAQPLNVPIAEYRDGAFILPTVSGNSFMKLISGFGGSNAALLFTLKA